MTIDDHEAVVGLLTVTPGVTLREADSRESTRRYLERNPGLSFVCEVDEAVVACVMCGHDGRRGYLQHLVVLPAYRNHGVGRKLVERCLTSLAEVGIFKSHIDVLTTNESAIAYWERLGWQLRTDLLRYSFIRAGDDNI